jgi:hypothetical protein
VEILFVTFGAVDFRAIFSCCGIVTPLLLLQASFQAVHFLGCFKNHCFGGPFLGSGQGDIGPGQIFSSLPIFFKSFLLGCLLGSSPPHVSNFALMIILPTKQTNKQKIAPDSDEQWYWLFYLQAACKNAPESTEAKRAVDLLFDTALISSGFSVRAPTKNFLSYYMACMI